MITGYAVQNFKNLAAIPAGEELLPLGPINLFIGPNGCGKSSLLQSIDFLRAFFFSSVEVYLERRGWQFEDLPNLRQVGKKIRWRLRVDLPRDEYGNGAGVYDFEVSLQPRRYLTVAEESLTFTPSSGRSIPLFVRSGRKLTYSEVKRKQRSEHSAEIVNHPASFLSTLDPESDRAGFPEALRFREWVERFRLYLLWDPERLRRPVSNQPGRFDRFGAEGDNLTGALLVLREREPAAFANLVRRIRDLVPTFTGLDFERTDTHSWLIQNEGEASRYNSQQMSDGILRLLAVSLMLYTDQPPSVVLFEEPENGIHPQLLREVVQILRELTQRKPPRRMQVFLTTHSPYVLDEFQDDPEAVYVMERNQPGAGASIVRLSDQRQVSKIRAGFGSSLGEAWATGLLGATARE